MHPLKSFFRIKKKNYSSIIVYAKKDKKLNLLIYDAINKILIKNNILHHKLINENYSKNFIEIEDFGNKTIFNFLKKKNKSKLLIFKKIISLLNKLQLIKNKRIMNFKKKNYIIPKYRPKNSYLKKQNFFLSGMYLKKYQKVKPIKIAKKIMKN